MVTVPFPPRRLAVPSMSWSSGFMPESVPAPVFCQRRLTSRQPSHHHAKPFSPKGDTPIPAKLQPAEPLVTRITFRLDCPKYRASVIPVDSRTEHMVTHLKPWFSGSLPDRVSRVRESKVELLQDRLLQGNSPGAT